MVIGFELAPACAYDGSVRPVASLRCLALAPWLVVACTRGPDPVRARPDATVRVDASWPRRPDATLPDAGAADASRDDVPRPSPRPALSVFIVGGGGLVREGAPVQVRVVRHSEGPDGDVDVTDAAAVRVEPASRGTVDAARRFRGTGRGRLQVFARHGADEAWTLVDVSNELPPGVDVIPTLSAGAGLVPLSVRFEVMPDGSIFAQFEFVNRSVTVEGRRAGRVFPITVPLRPVARAGEPVPPAPSAGTLVLDRWTAGRLDAHGTLRLDGRPVPVRFTVIVGEVASLTGPLAPRP